MKQCVTIGIPVEYSTMNKLKEHLVNNEWVYGIHYCEELGPKKARSMAMYTLCIQTGHICI